MSVRVVGSVKSMSKSTVPDVTHDVGPVACLKWSNGTPSILICD